MKEIGSSLILWVLLSGVIALQLTSASHADERQTINNQIDLNHLANESTNRSGIWQVIYQRGSGYGQCPQLSFGDVKIAGSSFTTVARHPRDGPFNIDATIHSDGQISGGANGTFVAVFVEGKLKGRRGELLTTMSGEIFCEARWDLVKVN